ncbi:MAG: 30S ribosomal protein S19e [Nitrososphaerota archaeon]
MSVRLVEPLQLIRTTARYLKENRIVSMPKWAPFVKTGVSKDRPPSDPDWWYVRCAAILRKLYIHNEGLGVSRLRRMYGGRHRMGHRNPHFAPGSGSVIRKALQQLEGAGLIEKSKKGRVLTKKGRQLLEEISDSILKRQAGKV